MGGAAMNEAAVKQKLSELNETIIEVPGGQTKASSEGVYYSHTSTKSQSVEETIDQLSLQVKYLLFDLEATRRENRYLRQMLENRRRPDQDDEGPKLF
jgi:3-phenylpropionate/cinnamic acid dioxygenase small subunit